MADVKISKFGDKGYRKYVGMRRGKDGKLTKKTWYLGDIRKRAERLAEYIVGQWKDLKAQGIKHWTDDAIARVNAYRDTGDEQQAQLARPTPKLTPDKKRVAASLTTHQLIDQYAAQYANGSRARVTVIVVKRTLDSLKTYIPDEPLHSVDAVKLQSYINTIANLPTSERTKKPLKPRTAKNLLDTFKQVLDWADMSDLWIAPRRFQNLFRAKVKVKNGAKLTYHPHELHALWKTADERQRTYMLLMLNCGFTSNDVANLLYDPNLAFSSNPDDYADGETYLFVDEDWDDTKLEDWERFDGWRIAGKRGKTNVFGVFPLWLDTAKALSAYLTNRSGRVFGDDLIEYTDVGRIDNVGRSLAKVVYAAHKANECRNIPPKVFRKTGAQMIRDIGGLEVSQIYLRHFDNTMAGRHYNSASFDKLASALKTMRDVNLTTMFGE